MTLEDRAERTAVLRARITELMNAGLTTEAIAKRLGRSSGAIRRHAIQMSIPPNYPWTADRGEFDL